jgi:hypothetical protein
MISERHPEWLMTMTGPHAAAERRALIDGAIKKFSKPGNDWICEMRLVRLSKSFRCFATMRPNGSISSLPSTSPSFGQKIDEPDVINASRSRLTSELLRQTRVHCTEMINRGAVSPHLRPEEASTSFQRLDGFLQLTCMYLMRWTVQR